MQVITFGNNGHVIRKELADPNLVSSLSLKENQAMETWRVDEVSPHISHMTIDSVARLAHERSGEMVEVTYRSSKQPDSTVKEILWLSAIADWLLLEKSSKPGKPKLEILDRLASGSGDYVKVSFRIVSIGVRPDDPPLRLPDLHIYPQFGNPYSFKPSLPQPELLAAGR